jgi:hypothetical protein
MKGSIRFPAFLSVLVFIISFCGCGGGGGSSPPLAVHTDNATSVTQNGAVLNGTVNPNGMAAEAWFEYGTNPNLASYDNTIIQNIAAGTVTQPVNQMLSKDSGTTYYYRLVALVAAGMRKGDLQFHHPQSSTCRHHRRPNLHHIERATLIGSVNLTGRHQRLVRVRDGSEPGSFTATDNQNLGSGRGFVPIDNTLSGLDTGVTFISGRWRQAEGR